MINKVSNIGMMGNVFRPMAGLDSVFGYDIAVDDNAKAMLEFGKQDKITYFYEPLQFQQLAIKRKFQALSHENKTETTLEFYSELDLLTKKESVDIDVLHNVGMEFLPQLSMREFISKKLFPITYTIHGASYPNYIENFYLMMLLTPIRPFDSLICTSESVKTAVKTILDNISDSLNRSYNTSIKYKGRLDVIPLGVDTEKFTFRDNRPIRMEMNIPEDAFVILWIGRLSAYDKADLLPLLIVFKRLLEKNPNQNLMLLIAGHDRASLPFLPAVEDKMNQLGIKDKVRIIEKNDVAKRHLLFSAADVFTSPADNLQETFGITPIEAMASGIPQVVSDWDGYKDTVEHGRTGFLIPTYWTGCDDDIRRAPMVFTDVNNRYGLHHLMLSQSVAVDMHLYERAFQDLIDDPELRKTMSLNSIERAKEKFSWKKVIRQYEDLWQELMTVRDQCEETYNEKQAREKEFEFMRPIYCKAFADYPTRFLGIESEAIITSEGRMTLLNEDQLPFHYEIENLLNEPKIGLLILKEMVKTADGTISMKECINVFKSNYHEDSIKRSFMWLIKHGLTNLKNNV
ncbi:glycosyltransferase involved in cell wall biosynthesis [Paenibacillus sp. JGP012]|uniref:glycosyltransferase family 4 protein n=1 Tax=Paenibacillus sp. JGP012 TaxID=2735914 RepID=UPI001621C1B8|nr:glycosyltransferase family 4 protein [Paenibacillus sp. JGP012]MBB6022762.1 glycosyltransferase involved in cell wall biosynthesis [Paenibacillus sp. JGP012]